MEEFSNLSAEKSPNKGLLVLKIAGIAVLVTIVGGGVALASRVWDPLWNPFRPDPQEVLDNMFEKMKGEESVHYEMEVTVVGESGGQQNQFDLALVGDSDVSDKENPKAGIEFTVEATSKPLNQNIAVRAGLRTIGQDSYFNLKEISLPDQTQAMLSMFGISVDQIKDKWLKFPGAFQNTEQSEKLKEKMATLLSEKDIFDIKEELPDEKVEGKDCYHYLLSLNKENFKELVSEFYKASLEGTQASFMAGGISEGVNDFVERVGGIEIDIWIAKNSDLLKAAASKEIKGEQLGAPEGDLSLSMEMTLSDFGKEVEVEAPADFQEVEDLFSPMMMIPNNSASQEFTPPPPPSF